MSHQQNPQFNRGLVMHPQMQSSGQLNSYNTLGSYNQGNFSYQQQQ